MEDHLLIKPDRCLLLDRQTPIWSEGGAIIHPVPIACPLVQRPPKRVKINSDGFPGSWNPMLHQKKSSIFWDEVS